MTIITDGAEALENMSQVILLGDGTPFVSSQGSFGHVLPFPAFPRTCILLCPQGFLTHTHWVV